MCSDYLTLYIYFLCIREIWIFVHPRKIIFPEGNAQGKYDYSEGEHIFISPLCKGNECFIPPGQRFGEICQMKSVGHLCLQNYYFGTSLELYRYMTKALNLENFENGKYDNVEREIRCCWKGNTMLW